MKQQSKKQHFTPAFLINRWASAVDGKVCQFSRPDGERIVANRKHPKATGFAMYTYGADTDHPGNKSVIEDMFFKPLDDAGQKAVHAFIDCGEDLSRDMHVDLTRFIVSLMIRHPTDVDNFRTVISHQLARFPTDRLHVLRADHPDLSDEELCEIVCQISPDLSEKLPLEAMIDTMRGGGLLQVVAEMHKVKYELLNCKFPLFLSDSCVISSGPLAQRASWMILPVSSNTILLMSRSREVIANIVKMSSNQISRTINKLMVGGAIKYCWAETDHQKSFVDRNFGRHRNPRISEILVKNSKR